MGGAYPHKTSYRFIFLIWRRIYEKIQKKKKKNWGVCRGLIPLKSVTISYFLFGGGSLRKSQELSLCSIFKMLVSKYLYGQWLIRINTKKIIWEVCRGLIPLKRQNLQILNFLSA